VKGVSADHDQPKQERCPRCGAPVLRALVGEVMALDVRADPTPIRLDQEAVLRAQGRLTWCLTLPSALLPQRIVWREPEHARPGRCPHTVLADHECPPPPALPTPWSWS
jgi:hypothetical protein